MDNNNLPNMYQMLKYIMDPNTSFVSRLEGEEIPEGYSITSGSGSVYWRCRIHDGIATLKLTYSTEVKGENDAR